MNRRLLARPVLGAALGALLACCIGAGCAADPPDPSEVRREQVQTRLEATFSGQQATCILESLDEATISALARARDLEAGSDELTTYSDAVALCVSGASTDPTTTTTTTGSAPSTTEGP